MIALLDDIELAYEETGSGEPVLFVHGFPHDRSLWDTQLAALSGRARCISVDLRGFGESSVQPPYSMDQWADDLAGLLDRLRIEQVVFCGLSMGGYIAFSFWRRHRHRVRALILMDTRADADAPESAQRRKDLIAQVEERGSAAAADALITGMLGKSTREKCPEIVDATHGMLEAAPAAGVIGALRAMMARQDSVPTLGTIDVPTLVLVGDEDVLTPPAVARSMAAGIKGSVLHVIARSGHLSNVERPATVNHLVSEFLASLSLT